MNKFLPIGTVLRSPSQNYVIRSILGSGGFGITYSATFSTTVNGLPVQATVAIKEHFLSGDCERDGNTQSVSYSQPVSERVERSRRDFVGEARRLQQVAKGHGSVVQVSEIFDANNTSYYVMEYLEGESLSDYVKSQGILGESETMSIMRPIIEAVAYLHKNKITHLDIKPANIMLAKDALGNKRPVLIDFGLSKHYNADGSATSTVNTLGFSDGYAPVEQYAGIKTFSPASDVYALAATIMFCLRGEALPRSIELTPDSLASIIPSDLSPKLRALLNSSLQMLVNQRPADAGVMRNRLADAGETQPIDESKIKTKNIDRGHTEPIDVSSQIKAAAEQTPVQSVDHISNPVKSEAETAKPLQSRESASKGVSVKFEGTETPKKKSLIIAMVVILAAFLIGAIIFLGRGSGNGDYEAANDTDSVAIATETVEAAPVVAVVIAGYEFVDLGLPSGKLWAKWNVGASADYEFGSYISWNNVNKNTPSELSVPAQADYKELINNCTVQTAQMNGVMGRLFTSKNNGNTIFFPSAGYEYEGSVEYSNSECEYWTSDLADNNINAIHYAFYPSDTEKNFDHGDRTVGMSLRLIK